MARPIRLTRRRNLLADAAHHPDATSYVVPVSIGQLLAAVVLMAVYAWLILTCITAPDLVGRQGLAWRIALVAIGTLTIALIVQLLLAPRVLVDDQQIVVVRAFQTYEIPWTDVAHAEWIGQERVNPVVIHLTHPHRGHATLDPARVAWTGANFVEPRTGNGRGRSDQLAGLINARRAANLGRFPPAKESSHVTTHASHPATTTYCATAIAAVAFLVVALTR